MRRLKTADAYGIITVVTPVVLNTSSPASSKPSWPMSSVRISDPDYLNIPEGRRDHTTPAEALRLHSLD